MAYPPVCADNPRALVSVLSNVHVDKQGITILYHLNQCEIFRAKGGIIQVNSKRVCSFRA